MVAFRSPPLFCPASRLESLPVVPRGHCQCTEDRTRCVAASLLLPLRQGHDKTARKTTACLLPWSPTVPLVRRQRKRVETLPMDGCIPVGLRGRLTVVSGDRPCACSPLYLSLSRSICRNSS